MIQIGTDPYSPREHRNKKGMERSFTPNRGDVGQKFGKAPRHEQQRPFSLQHASSCEASTFCVRDFLFLTMFVALDGVQTPCWIEKERSVFV